jgi:putative ABC transport system permease protein
LAASGGLAGLVLAPWLLRAFLLLYPGTLPAVGGVSLRLSAVAAAAGATLITALASVVPSLLHGRARNLLAAMRATDRGSDSLTQRRARTVLVLAQIAMSTVLLIGGGLLLRTFWIMQATPLGFATEHLLTFNVALSERQYPAIADESRFYDRLFERVRAMPGVTAAGATSLLPLTPGEFIDGFAREGFPDTFPKLPLARLQNVTPGYLEAVGLPVRAGRTIRATDRGDAPRVAVVNDTLQSRYFPQGAVGRRIKFRGQMVEIVGVVADKRHRSLRETPRTDFYLPRAQSADPRLFGWIAIRSAGDVSALVPLTRAAVRALDPGIAIDNLATMDERVQRALAPDRFRACLMAALAGVALLLAAIGLYGLIAYSVARDARDIAIRMALGASAGRTVGHVVRRVLGLTLVGVIMGIGLALVGQRLLAGFLSGITAHDPITVAAVSLGLLIVAGLAAAGPARRASRIDPAALLRS